MMALLTRCRFHTASLFVAEIETLRVSSCRGPRSEAWHAEALVAQRHAVREELRLAAIQAQLCGRAGIGQVCQGIGAVDSGEAWWWCGGVADQVPPAKEALCLRRHRVRREPNP